MTELTIAAQQNELYQVLKFVEKQLKPFECPKEIMVQLNIVLEELFVNIASYAYYPKTGFVTIQVHIEERDREVMITFLDSGVPYNPLEKQDPDITLSAEERQVGGLGIFMVKKMMDAVTYRYENGNNILTVKKRF